MKHELDDRLARIDELARWWTQATQKARFEAIHKAITEGIPDFQTLRLAIIVAEVEAGQVEEG